jgi:transcriptional regulator with XRE-family HTH domain
MSKSALTIFREDRRLTLEQVAKMFGVQKAAVWKWERRGPPASKVLQIEAVTGISRHDLRPDIFGPSPQEAA